MENRSGRKILWNRITSYNVCYTKLLRIVDDATVPGKRGSFGIDDEGTTGQRTVLVSDGVLKGFLYDRLHAMKEGVRSTGNGRRESYRHRTVPRMTNTIILPGETPPEEIVGSVDRGLLVRKMGGGQVNTVTGDFMFEVAEGYRITSYNVCYTKLLRWVNWRS